MGESSPAYLYSPVAAARIHETIPDAKIVVVLRDPADRAYSHWVDNVANRWEPVHDFAKVLDLAEERRRQNWWRKWDYVGHGFYAAQLKRYLDRFPAHQVKVLLFDDMLGEHPRGIDDLCEFLDLDPAPFGRQELPRAKSVVCHDPHPHGVLSGHNPVRSSLRRVLPSTIRARVRNALVRRNTVRRPLERATRAKLHEIYRDDIHKLEGLLDRDLSALAETSA